MKHHMTKAAQRHMIYFGAVASTRKSKEMKEYQQWAEKKII